MGRLANLRVVDPVLSNLISGYSNDDLVAEKLMPFVTVDKEGGVIPKFGKESFRLPNTERAIRAASNRMQPEAVGDVKVVLDEHDLEYPIDYRETAEAAYPLQAYAANVVTEIIRLRHEKKVADMALNPALYGDTNKIALTGNAKFSNKSSEPIGVFEDGKDAMRAQIGRNPSLMIFGPKAWKLVKNHASFLERIKYSQRGVMTTELLSQIIGIPNIYVGNAVYTDSNGVTHDVWGDGIVMAYVAQPRTGAARTPYEPSYGYTLRKRGMPQVDTRLEGGKVEIVRATDIFQPVLLGADAGYLITGAL